MNQKSKVIKIALLVILCLLVLTGFVKADGVTNDEAAKIEAASPDKPVVEPKQPRKMLVFNLCKGYKHESIPYGAKALEIMGKKTGAFEAVQSSDMSVFKPENLKQFDAICFNNTTRLEFNSPELRKSLMDFVKNGGGIVGIHAAVDNFYEWPEGAEMMGGLFDGHPWLWNDTVTIGIDDSDHRLCKMFAGKGFEVTDEIYQIKEPYSREKLRVLLAIDTGKTDMNKKGLKRKDCDYAISWVRRFGEGRVFYCSLGHNPHIFWDAKIMKYYLGGIQFALGDLDVDTAVSGSTLKVIEDTLAQIKTYQYGQSRMPLTKITELMRKYYNVPEVTGKVESMFLDFLRSGASLPAKQFICRELSIIGTEKSTEVLSNMLGDAKTADMALYAMQRIPSDSIDKALRRMLDKTSGMAKVGVINAIGARRDSKAVSALASLIRNADPLIDEAAICALGNIANLQASEVLAKVKERTEGRLHLLALDAYLKCADNFAAAGREKEALAIYEQLYSTNETVQIRNAALRGKVITQKEEAVGIIIDVLEGDNAKMQAVAIGLINQIPGRKMTKALTKQLFELSPHLQALLLSALAERGDAVALPAVIKTAKSEDKTVRIAALQALGKLGDASTVTLLVEKAATGKGDEQKTARQSLYSLTGEKVNETIVNNLSRERKTENKLELIRGINQRRIETAADVLLKSAKDSDGKVRIEALKALRVVAKPDDLPALIDTIITAKSDAERDQAEKTTMVVANKITGAGKVEALLKKLHSVQDVADRCSLISVLGRIGDKDGLGVIREALKDGDIKVSNAAVRALSQWPDAEPIDDLLKVAGTSSNKTQQILALRGFVRLLALDSSRTSRETSALYTEAMNLATDVSEKKMVLAGLANMKDEASLLMAAKYLDNKQLQQEAAAAVMKIALAVSGAYPEQTKAALLKMIKVAADESLRKQAIELLDNIEGYADYLVAWQVSGPYIEKGKEAQALFDVVFAPEKPDDNTAVWKIMRVANDKGKVGVVELFKVFSGSNRVAYLRNKVWSEKKRKLRLELGSDDGIKVWLNGKLVHSNNALRACKRGEDVVDVELKQGWNRMLLKITQAVGGFEACARFRNLDGTIVEGLKVKAE